VFAEHLNFTRAAEELRLSQPALHVKINKLGSALGVGLYERDGRSLLLTSAGRDVARFAANLETDLRAFVIELGSASTDTPLVIAAGEGALSYVLAGGIRRLLASGSEIQLITTNTDETIDAVRTSRADLGVAVLRTRPRGLRVRELATYPQVLALPAGHPLARNRVVHLGDLDGASLVVPPTGRPHRSTIDQALRRARVATSIGIEAEGWAQMLHFVSLGVGLAIVNGCVTTPSDLVARPIADLPPITYSALVRPDDLAETKIRAVLDVIESTVP
jgi:LysR family transcriptional regulator, low CO2-responsive transcriptional regulator